jgi:hypothetical protein
MKHKIFNKFSHRRFFIRMIGGLLIAMCGVITIIASIPPDPPGLVYGTVSNANTGDPIEGAVVECDGTEATTDEEGRFWLTNLTVGTKQISASMDGYETYNGYVDVTSAGTEIDIELQAKSFIVTQPTSSTVWTQGDQDVNISWDTGNLGGTVDITLYKGSSSVATIASAAANDGSYTSWDVPSAQTPGIDYRVRVYYDSSNYDYSDYFEVEIQTDSIAVTQPTSSTVWTQGDQNVNISWDTGNLGGTVDITLYKGSNSVTTIASATTNDGSYTSWDVPSDQTPGTDYRVRVYYDSSNYDYSDYFEVEIQTDSIAVTQPTSSTVWTQGDQNVSIIWDTGNLGGTVDITLYKGSSSVATIASATANDGSYISWDVPSAQTPGTDYRVRVYNSSTYYDYSDYFTIQAKPEIRVTMPTSNTVWTQGDQNVSISWDTGNLGGTVDITLYKGSSSVATIASATTNDGSYTSWDVPSAQTPGTDYRVRVYNSSTYYDYSDYFTISTKYIDVEVTLLQITVISDGDATGAGELFWNFGGIIIGGKLYSFYELDRSRDDPLSVQDLTTYYINTALSFEILKKDTSYFTVQCEMWEDDVFDDDELGGFSFTYNYADWPDIPPGPVTNAYSEQLTGTEADVVVYWTIKYSIP